MMTKNDRNARRRTDRLFAKMTAEVAERIRTQRREELDRAWEMLAKVQSSKPVKSFKTVHCLRLLAPQGKWGPH